MQIHIENCNNIDSGVIEMRASALNIKYAINGTGKSTLARAIVASIKDRQAGNNSLHELLPFKHKGAENIVPRLTGIEQFTSVRVFDENYIKDFVFNADELIKGSFDIFIRDANYEKGLAEIDSYVSVIQQVLSTDRELSELVQDFDEISASFGRPVKAGVHGSSVLAKSLKSGNKVSHIPEGLEAFTPFIQHDENYKWIKWQCDGLNFGAISDGCPYCVSDISDMKSSIAKISETYEPKSIEALNKIVGAFARLSRYFSDEARSKIDEFVKNIDGYTDDQIAYLKEIKDQIDRLRVKFLNAQSLSFVSLKDNPDATLAGLAAHKIDLELFIHLKSDSTLSKAMVVNNAIDEISAKAGELQGSVTKQNRIIEKLVKKHGSEINMFLKNAGYSYSVILAEDESGKHKLKLVHNDIANQVDNVRAHLSFGERNAFALILFMYDVLKEKPDLIVLDDPISSFDKNKKYAILDILFKRGGSFRDKTVLFLTHDLEPIIDMTYHHPDRFSKPFSSFLENVHGILVEKEIQKSDIKTFSEINCENLAINITDVSKLVYLRRSYEVLASKDYAYDILSCLLHKREIPTKTVDGQLVTLTAEQIELGVEKIKKSIPNFDYLTILKQLSNADEMKGLYRASNNNYEKLHIFRVMFDGQKFDDNIESDVIRKFIHESFHIENNYMFQLNPVKFQLVPQYVIDECDKSMNL
jgi:energy-coupling factor transporter ATP-binding protein EcfA2